MLKRIVFVYRFKFQLPLHSYFVSSWLWLPIRTQFGCSLESNLSDQMISFFGKVYQRQATDSVNCENSSLSFVMKYGPTLSIVKNPASVRNLITQFCENSLSTRSGYFFAWSSSYAGSPVQDEGVFINELFGRNNGSDCFYQNKSHCSNMTSFVFFTHFFDCSVKTELIYRYHHAKNNFNRSSIKKRSAWLFPPTFVFSALPRDNGLVDLKTGCLLSPNLIIINSATQSHFFVFFFNE